MQGIKLNTQGVRATLDRSKTMFREPMEDTTILNICEISGEVSTVSSWPENKRYTKSEFIEEHAKYKVGEELFVQEEFTVSNHGTHVYSADGRDKNGYLWPTVAKDILGVDWLHASEMTKEQSRLKIRITGRKFEYLQDISEEDCIKEGFKITSELGEDYREKCIYFNGYFLAMCEMYGDASSDIAKRVYRTKVWKPLNYPPKYQWSANPPVFAYEYEVVS